MRLKRRKNINQPHSLVKNFGFDAILLKIDQALAILESQGNN